MEIMPLPGTEGIDLALCSHLSAQIPIRTLYRLLLAHLSQLLLAMPQILSDMWTPAEQSRNMQLHLELWHAQQIL